MNMNFFFGFGTRGKLSNGFSALPSFYCHPIDVRASCPCIRKIHYFLNYMPRKGKKASIEIRVSTFGLRLSDNRLTYLLSYHIFVHSMDITLIFDEIFIQNVYNIMVIMA